MKEGGDGASQKNEQRKRKQSDVHDGLQVNGDSTRSKPSKEERREAKRLKKQQKLENGDEGAVNEAVVGSTKEAEGGLVAAKGARKAEKKRLKALKKAKDAATTDSMPTHTSTHSAVNGVSRSTKDTTSSQSLQTEYQENESLTALPQSEIDPFLFKNLIAVDDPSTATSLRPITDFSYLPKDAQPSSPVFANFKNPTPIQAAAWPFLLSGRDVIGVAETGSGKTLAFGIPCIRSITAAPPVSKGKSPARAVIISPTRELALQIHTQISQLALPLSLSTVCVYGGVPKDTQRISLKTAHIIVATPGRLNDLITEGSADLRNVRYLVLDEADRMLDKGFEDEIRKIISTTPSSSSSPGGGRQTAMFTATWPPSVRALASTFMSHPVHITIGADNPTNTLRANANIIQLIHVISPAEKQSRLLSLLSQYHPHPSKAKSHEKEKPRILLFCLYKKEAARISSLLTTRTPYPTAAIHGSMTQTAREHSLRSFKTGQCTVLVATDVAARGLDIPDVKVVINLTFPLTVEDYVHRIGRTGRAGAEGLAVTLFTEEEKGLAGGLVNVLRQAGQEVPEALLNFGGTVKKRGHEAYGAFYREVGEGRKEGTKIRFDD
ncbi:RNA-dependent ATPase [Lecanora helva]